MAIDLEMTDSYDGDLVGWRFYSSRLVEVFNTIRNPTASMCFCFTRGWLMYDGNEAREQVRHRNSRINDQIQLQVLGYFLHNSYINNS